MNQPFRNKTKLPHSETLTSEDHLQDAVLRLLTNNEYHEGAYMIMSKPNQNSSEASIKAGIAMAKANNINLNLPLTYLDKNKDKIEKITLIHFVQDLDLQSLEGLNYSYQQIKLMIKPLPFVVEESTYLALKQHLTGEVTPIDVSLYALPFDDMIKLLIKGIKDKMVDKHFNRAYALNEEVRLLRQIVEHQNYADQWTSDALAQIFEAHLKTHENKFLRKHEQFFYLPNTVPVNLTIDTLSEYFNRGVELLNEYTLSSLRDIIEKNINEYQLCQIFFSDEFDYLTDQQRAYWLKASPLKVLSTVAHLALAATTLGDQSTFEKITAAYAYLSDQIQACDRLDIDDAVNISSELDRCFSATTYRDLGAIYIDLNLTSLPKERVLKRMEKQIQGHEESNRSHNAIKANLIALYLETHKPKFYREKQPDVEPLSLAFGYQPIISSLAKYRELDVYEETTINKLKNDFQGLSASELKAPHIRRILQNYVDAFVDQHKNLYNDKLKASIFPDNPFNKKYYRINLNNVLNMCNKISYEVFDQAALQSLAHCLIMNGEKSYSSSSKPLFHAIDLNIDINVEDETGNVLSVNLLDSLLSMLESSDNDLSEDIAILLTAQNQFDQGGLSKHRDCRNASVTDMSL